MPIEQEAKTFADQEKMSFVHIRPDFLEKYYTAYAQIMEVVDQPPAVIARAFKGGSKPKAFSTMERHVLEFANAQAAIVSTELLDDMNRIDNEGEALAGKLLAACRKHYNDNRPLQVAARSQ